MMRDKNPVKTDLDETTDECRKLIEWAALLNRSYIFWVYDSGMFTKEEILGTHFKHQDKIWEIKAIDTNWKYKGKDFLYKVLGIEVDKLK